MIPNEARQDDHYIALSSEVGKCPINDNRL